MNGFEIEKTKEQKCSSKLVQDATIIHKIFETYSSFHEKQCTPGKVNFYFSRIFLTLLTKFLYLQEEWALGYHSMKLRHFSDIS